jgi:hypothetical protein
MAEDGQWMKYTYIFIICICRCRPANACPHTPFTPSSPRLTSSPTIPASSRRCAHERPTAMATPPQASHAKGRYERPAPLALASVKAEATASRTSLASPATPASSRAQFEGQEDFISFDASPPPPAPRFIPKKQRDSTASKRKLDEFEEKAEEKNERVKRRERERTTPWCVDPGVDWAACQSATAMCVGPLSARSST